MRFCLRCGFILDTRPGLLSRDGVCLACINSDSKKDIDFDKRQKWLTSYIQENKSHDKYDCVIAVSGGKDSHMIVKRLFENHGVKNALLVTVADEFTKTRAGQHNIDNLCKRYNCDHIIYRCEPHTFIRETRKDFFNELHPLKWIEKKIYSVPVEIAKAHGISIVFFGENSAFEYGTHEELEIFHRRPMRGVKVIFMGAIYPYSITDSLTQAKEIGFKDLDDFGEWPRQGSIDQFSQIDSLGYIIQLWTKYVKFGFQRVSDIACRYVRESSMTRETALKLIDERDYICDPIAKMDFCRTIDITQAEFDTAVDKHANKKIVEKIDGVWKRKK